MYLDIVKKADSKVQEFFDYKIEPEDDWTYDIKSLIKAIEANDRSYVVTNDCDALAMLTVEYAVYLGVPEEYLGRAMVNSTSNSDEPDHMVGIFNDKENNQMYFIGDTFGSICRIRERTHKIIFINWLKDKLDWLRVDNTTSF